MLLYRYEDIKLVCNPGCIYEDGLWFLWTSDNSQWTEAFMDQDSSHSFDLPDSSLEPRRLSHCLAYNCCVSCTAPYLYLQAAWWSSPQEPWIDRGLAMLKAMLKEVMEAQPCWRRLSPVYRSSADVVCYYERCCGGSRKMMYDIAYIGWARHDGLCL